MLSATDAGTRVVLFVNKPLEYGCTDSRRKVSVVDNGLCANFAGDARWCKALEPLEVFGGAQVFREKAYLRKNIAMKQRGRQHRKFCADTC